MSFRYSHFSIKTHANQCGDTLKYTGKTSIGHYTKYCIMCNIKPGSRDIYSTSGLLNIIFVNIFIFLSTCTVSK